MSRQPPNLIPGFHEARALYNDGRHRITVNVVLDKARSCTELMKTPDAWWNINRRDSRYNVSRYKGRFPKVNKVPTYSYAARQSSLNLPRSKRALGRVPDHPNGPRQPYE